MTVFTILGLIFNIKTNVIHNESKQLLRLLNDLKEENRLLEYQVLKQSRLDKVEHYAREKLGMVPIKNIIFFNPTPTDNNAQ